MGSVKMNVKLTGMPELRLGLNDKVLFEATGREFVCMSVHSLSVLFSFQETVQKLLNWRM